VVSYGPAVVVALGTKGWPATAVWFSSTGICAVATKLLVKQWRRLLPTRVI
jgi:hypothetical protein